MNPHTELVKEALVELSRNGHFCWNNESGTGWVGKLMGRNKAGQTVLSNARPVAFGLPGSADILGVLISGHALAAEAKTGTGRQQKNQGNFQTAWEKRGGIYVLFRSVDQLIEDINNAVK